MYAERVSRIRELMAQNGMDAYIISPADYHQSEYVGDYFKARAYVTGFTGTAGTAVIAKDDAGLWTDGRYFIQAEKQLDGSGVSLYKMGNPGVPTVQDFVVASVPAGGKLGFDGRLLAKQEGEDLVNALAAKGATVDYRFDFVDMIWSDRPSLPQEPIFMLEDRFSGESAASKIARVREAMAKAGANRHVMTTLDDIAWLLNIRGNDIKFSPLVLCYALISNDVVELFIDDSRMPEEVKAALTGSGVVFKSYNEIYDRVKDFGSDDVVLLDPDRINYALYMNIPQAVKKVEAQNPTILFKAIKNDVELANIVNAHIKDGVANTRLMYWLKNEVKNMKITELSASDKLEEFRKEQDGYLWQSFSPICAFKDHAAMMHYSSTPESDVQLEEGHFFLCDTGGNYFEGSTDITRTIALGEVSHELKVHFTAVAKGMMNLSRAKFMYGCRGYNLDILARGPIWDLAIDYKCGTGHGIGYLLNIHEGPAGFRWYIVPSKNETHPLEAGMVLTNEPGIYVEGSHGIRIENEMVVRKGPENPLGQFMFFEAVTFCPIDLDAIVVENLNEDEKTYLNSYHKMVFEKVAPHLPENEREWLKQYTRAI